MQTKRDVITLNVTLLNQKPNIFKTKVGRRRALIRSVEKVQYQQGYTIKPYNNINTINKSDKDLMLLTQ